METKRPADRTVHGPQAPDAPVAPLSDAAADVAHELAGTWEPGELDRLRDEWD